MASYSWRDGQRVAPGTLAAFDLLRAAFYAVFGLWLLISSGTRTYQEQINIFLSRYVRAGDVRGRRVYDTRWWNGVLWYRVSSAGTVAAPGTSNHENDRALDIRDTGNTPGVTSFNNARSNWIRVNAGRFGFNANGFGFGEPWHIEFTGDPWAGGGSAAGGSEGWNMATADEVLAAVNNMAQILVGRGASIDDPKWSPGPNSIMGTVRNIGAHLYGGGPSATDPNYLGAPGTVYALLKSPVTRTIGDKTVKIAQIQDNADTNSMVRELLARPSLTLTDANIEALADSIGAALTDRKPLTADETRAVVADALAGIVLRAERDA